MLRFSGLAPLALVAGLAACAQVYSDLAGKSMMDSMDSMGPYTYKVVITNNLADELLAPVLVAPSTHDGKIFTGAYVSPEAEKQILTGDPGDLAAAIGDEATVAHGMDGPPGVLLAPGSSLEFEVTTSASTWRIIAMVAPTMVPDHFVSAIVSPGEMVSATLNRFDVGHDEERMSIQPVAKAVADVSISRM